MAKSSKLFAHISIILPVDQLNDIVSTEAKIKEAISDLPEYRYDFQLAERKGGRGLDNPTKEPGPPDS